MKKTTPQTLTANWSRIGNHAPWSLITSPMLAKVLGVHLQTISNYRIRGILPAPEPATAKLKGNVVRYRISAILAWLEGSSEEEVTWKWIKTHIPDPVQTIGQARSLVNACWMMMDIEKPIGA
jgi:predicted DNA-binding transcriptional regulator AlpA